jgi:hypothetical protein
VLRGRWAAIAAACATALVAAVAAGCGGGGSSSSSALQLDPVAAAATKTQNAGAARIRFAIALSSPQLQGRLVHLRGTGALDGTSAEMSFKLGSMLKGMGLPSGAGSGALGMLKHSSIKEILLEQNGDYVIYMRIPFLSSQIPGGKTWMKLDLSKLGKSAGIDMSKLLSSSQLEPTDLLSILKSEGATVDKVGSATIDGVGTTQYRVKVNTAKALKAKGLTSPVFSGMAKKAKTITENVWVGKDGLVRRVAFNYALPQAGSSRMAMTMDLFDYGAHVSIAAPPSSQVFDMTQFAKQGLASSGG